MVTMGDKCKVTVGDVKKSYEEGTSFLEIAKEWQGQYDNDIVLVLRDGKLCELRKKVSGDCTLQFLTTATAPGIEAYKRSATLIMLKAFYEVFGAKVIEKITHLYYNNRYK